MCWPRAGLCSTVLGCEWTLSSVQVGPTVVCYENPGNPVLLCWPPAGTGLPIPIPGRRLLAVCCVSGLGTAD